MGKMLILIGVVLIVIGLILEYSDKIPLLGKLPGDIVIDKGNLKFYFPITTSLLLSIIITIVVYIVRWLKG